ncbi:TetR family transcriptional regulator [Streptomyces laurentii]|uniref:TetR family transcriptional regulator n=1 Tax=Streptomyces laurentii TaxID=39478 RepID=UPI003F4D29C8
MGSVPQSSPRPLVPQPPAPRPATGPALRRAPIQRRSAERLARILDACAELLDETGYERLSTRAVAVRAGVPIGSVYRFFGNKRAMAAALAHRNLDRYAARVAAGLAALPAPAVASGEGGAVLRPVDAGRIIDAVLDAYLAMKRTVPGFGLVDFGVPDPCAAPDEPEGSGVAEGSGENPNHLVADRICGLLAGPLGWSADDTLRRKVLVGVETTDALLRLAFRTDPSGDPALVAETRTLLYAYLAPALARPRGTH